MAELDAVALISEISRLKDAHQESMDFKQVRMGQLAEEVARLRKWQREAARLFWEYAELADEPDGEAFDAYCRICEFMDVKEEPVDAGADKP